MFLVGNINGPTVQDQKDNFWKSLGDQCDGKTLLPYYLVGDFNITIFAEEWRGGTKVRDPFGERLEDLISLWGLSDIKPKNGSFTWSNKRIGPSHIAACLDRVIISTHHLTSQAETKLLCSAISDNKLICLFFPPLENLGPLPFCFSHLWLEVDGFKEIVAEAWCCFIPGSPAFSWEQKNQKSQTCPQIMG